MPFAIEISEVGEAEYPLLQTLRDTIFAEFGHVGATPIERQLAHRQDLLVLIAHLEGNPVGFSVGCRRNAVTFYMNYLALLRDYRGQGLGLQLLRRQEDFARAAKYRQIQFNTFNHFPGMIRLGLRSGYEVVGLEQNDGTRNDLSIRFGKLLTGEAVPPGRKVANGNELRIRASDVEKIFDATEKGASIVGVVRDPQDGALIVILRSLLPS